MKKIFVAILAISLISSNAVSCLHFSKDYQGHIKEDLQEVVLKDGSGRELNTWLKKNKFNPMPYEN